ncbi:MAG TPA: FeoA domain-containing protein [Bryobacteraceae bacterium]|nr:FeoA domain-containing protein [Bryobacteraceae bacterium]
MTSQRTLADLLENQQALVESLNLPEDLAGRLMELGFVPGQAVTAARSAPGGDPRVFRVDGAEVALRRETALHIHLKPESAD